MKKYLTYLMFLLAAVHFLLLYIYGIAWFGTTLLFYLLIYTVVKWSISFVKNAMLKQTLLRNVQVLIFLLLVIELSLTFIFKTGNNFMENETGVYFSEYMRKPQLNLLHFLGWKDVQMSFENGYKPNTKRIHHTDEFNYSYVTNKSGMRGLLPSIEKNKNEYRIVVLGDSFVEGFGSPDDSTFPVLLQNQLNYENKKITVINAGICGSNPLYEIKLYKNLLKKYNPDMVLLQTNIMDISDVEYVINQNNMPLREYFFAASRIIRGFYSGVLKNNKFKNVEYKKTENIHLIVTRLSDFNRQLKGISKFSVILMPSLNKAYHVIDKELMTEQYKNALLKSGIQVIDLQKEYKTISFMYTDRLKRYFWEKDGHHTPEGYYLMSKIVAQQLSEKKDF